MLVRFTVENYLCFDQSETFSMEAGKTRNYSERTNKRAGVKVLKFKAIYGANSAGKSSLINAIDFMQSSIVVGIPNGTSQSYCRLKSSNASRLSRFEADIILGNTYYTYGFDVLLSEGRFAKEWLYERRGSKSQLVFSRDISQGVYDVDPLASDHMLSERLAIYADDIKTDGSVLFLHTMNQNRDSLYSNESKIKILQSLFRWFRYKLNINYPDEAITEYTYFFNSQDSYAAEEMLSQLDTGISKIVVHDEPTEKVMAQFPKRMVQDITDNLTEQKRRLNKEKRDGVPAIVIRSSEGHTMFLIEQKEDDITCKTIMFNHKHGDSLFSLMEESDGTIRLLDLIEVLLSTAKDQVYVIDEVNRCLHPLLTKQFVQRFLEMAETRNIQLIVTTHETCLMDIGLLRQDEIGFVEKRDHDGSSRIFNLEEYGARYDKRIRTAYMKGLYDAIPKF